MTDRVEITLLRKDLKNAEFVIQRQNVEIERLTKKCDSLNTVIGDKKNEIRRLKYRVKKLENYDQARDIALHSRLIKQATDEAFKAFAEKVKNFMDDVPTHSEEDFIYVDYFELRDRIDNFVKERVGEVID